MKKIFFTLSLLALFPVTTVLAETQSSSSTEVSTIVSNEQSTVSSSQPEDFSSDHTETSSSSSSVTEPSSSNSSTDLNLQDEKEKIIDQIEKDTGIKKSEQPITQSKDASELRKLLKEEYMSDLITPQEVDSYSDQQLLNAMTLCNRMSSDTYGLDVSGYARILQALYKDHSISWNAVEKNLNYNPSNYVNARQMSNQIEQLQTYLAALYPPNSSFMPIRKMSNQELINVLNYISPMQEEILKNEGYLFPGIIAWIEHYSNNQTALNGATTTSSETVTSPESSSLSENKGQDIGNKKPVSEKNNDKNISTSLLPKTGENRKLGFTILGIVILIFAAIALFRKNSRK